MPDDDNIVSLRLISNLTHLLKKTQDRLFNSTREHSMMKWIGSVEAEENQMQLSSKKKFGQKCAVHDAKRVQR